MNSQYAICVILAMVLVGCSSPDELISEEEQPLVLDEGAYADECRWVYRQMNHYYLWRDEMPDSLTCDYTKDPVSFFKSLLSAKDRFSYCERNTSYTGGQEVFKDDGSDLLPAMTRGAQGNVLLDTIYHIRDKYIGYFCYLQFESIAELGPTLRRFYEDGIDELIVDLRYNPGGFVSVCKYLCNSIVDSRGYGEVFQYQSFNDRLAAEKEQETGSPMESEYYQTPPEDLSTFLGTPVYSLDMPNIYVLTSRRTASASEALIKCLSPFTNVVTIGETTVGKGVGSFTISDGKYKYALHPITMRYYNADMQTTPDEGITPDYEVPNGYETPKRDIGKLEESLLSKAIELIFEEASE